MIIWFGPDLLTIGILINNAFKVFTTFGSWFAWHVTYSRCFVGVGLCRTCEIFGVSEIVFSSKHVIEEKEFKSLSVTSEKWVKISEVSCRCD